MRIDFGTFKKAIFAVMREMNPELMGPWPAEVDRSVRGFERRGPRTINLRMRFLILRRDRFRCCACGRSPATDAGVTLQRGSYCAVERRRGVGGGESADAVCDVQRWQIRFAVGGGRGARHWCDQRTTR